MSPRRSGSRARTRAGASLHGRDVLTLADLSAAEIATVFDTAVRLKARPGAFRGALAGRVLLMLFEKPSLRTRVTFEAGPVRLGAHAIYFDHSRERIGQRESVADYGRNLERWVDAVVARVYAHEVLEALAQACAVPVINALSDRHHPCQALADFFTLAERFGGLGGLRGLTLTYIGDGNNVCHSLLHGAAALGVRLRVICPPAYRPHPPVVRQAQALAQRSGGHIEIVHDPARVAGSAAVYTDTWVSMGDEAQTNERLAAFAPYRVDEALMAAAGPDTLFMHCLPAHRGVEVTDGVIDSPRSLVYEQAENRMHVQNALLLHILGGEIRRPRRPRARTPHVPAAPVAPSPRRPRPTRGNR